jgi:hypothetical protein
MLRAWVLTRFKQFQTTQERYSLIKSYRRSILSSPFARILNYVYWLLGLVSKLAIVCKSQMIANFLYSLFLVIYLL